MNKSLFKKILKTIGISSIVSIIITVLFFSFIIKEYVLSIELSQIKQKIDNTISKYDLGNNKLGERLKISLGKGVLIKGYDSEGNNTFRYYTVDNLKIKVNYEQTNKSLDSYSKQILKGKKIYGIENVEGINGKSIVIGEPIIENKKVSSAILIVKPVKEFDKILLGFYVVLVFSLIIVLLSTSIPIYIVTKKLFKPLEDMTKATIKMSKGDFSTKIEENQNDEVGELAKAFNYLSSKLEQNEEEAKKLEQMRKDYVANVSHELKTPITSIRAVAEILNDEEIEDALDKKKYYSMILRESIRMQILIKDILELSSLQSSNLPIEKEIVNLYNLIQDVYLKFEVIAQDLDIEFNIPKSDLKSIDVFTNYNRIVQVMIILLDNAFKFTGEEGRICIDVEDNNEFVNIVISDTGIGIDKEDLPFVFDRFYKVDKSRKSNGTGIGLSIASEIIAHLNETICVESEIGLGSKFIFTIHYN